MPDGRDVERPEAAPAELRRASLLPAPGARDRYRVLEWLNYVGTEIHKACYATMFTTDAPPEAKAWARGALDKKLVYVAKQLEGREFAVGEGFTIADAYLTWSLLLAQRIGATFEAAALAYLEGIQKRPAVQCAIATETAALGKS